MLEFFGMKPVIGPNACFQFIEQREPPSPKKTKAHQGALQADDLAAVTAISFGGGASAAGVAKNRNGREDEHNLWEPGPEHFAEAEGVKDTTIEGFTDKEGQVVEDENAPRLRAVACEDQEDEPARMQDKSREEVKRMSKNSLHGLQPYEPGPEYINGADRAEDRESRVEDEVAAGRTAATNSFEVSTGTAAVAAAADDADAVAARDAAKEGGGFGEPSMATTDATPGTTAATATAAAAGTTGVSMDYGSGGVPGAVLIKGAQIVNDDSMYVADVLIQDNIIQKVSSNIEAPQGAQVIDGTGKALMPAGIDIHTELLSESADVFETVSKAALAGGTATVIGVIQPGANETLLAAYDRLSKAMESKSMCNFAFSALVSEWTDLTKKEMSLLVHDKGINSFIIDAQKDSELFEIFDYCRSLRVHARIIPENKDIIALLEKRLRLSGVTGAECFSLSRPHALEADMVNRVSVLGKLANCPVAVVSLCSTEAADVVLRQRSSMLIPEIPVAALAEKCDEQSNMVLKSSWRYAEPPSPLVDCLSSVPLCICVSNHCGMWKINSTADKLAQTAASAAEERMSVLWDKGVLSGRIDPMRFVAVTSSNAAKVFNLYPRKGRIAVGADADLVMWELSVKHQISSSKQQSRGDLPLFEPPAVKPLMTVCGGRIAYHGGKFESGRGKLVELAAHSPYLYCLVEQLERVHLNGSVNNGDSAPTSDQPTRRENLINNSRAFPAKNIQKQFEPSYSAGMPNDMRSVRASTKVLNPPGGRSTGFW